MGLPVTMAGTYALDIPIQENGGPEHVLELYMGSPSNVPTTPSRRQMGLALYTISVEAALCY